MTRSGRNQIAPLESFGEKEEDDEESIVPAAAAGSVSDGLSVVATRRAMPKTQKQAMKNLIMSQRSQKDPPIMSRIRSQGHILRVFQQHA